MKTVDFDKKTPRRVIHDKSAWRGLESILESLMARYKVDNKLALEFGVEFGYSTVALSNFFNLVVGVDTFGGDIHNKFKGDYKKAKENCASYKNIDLIQADYKDFIKSDDSWYDLIHIDIVHTYEDTFACGKWAIKHAPVVIFHDTESFPDVRQAVDDLSKGNWDNYPHHYGLGIIHTL